MSTGKDGKDTPVGVFPILQKREMHRSNLYNSAPMPFMQRLTWDGVARFMRATIRLPPIRMAASDSCGFCKEAVLDHLGGDERDRHRSDGRGSPRPDAVGDGSQPGESGATGVTVAVRFYRMRFDFAQRDRPVVLNPKLRSPERRRRPRENLNHQTQRPKLRPKRRLIGKCKCVDTQRRRRVDIGAVVVDEHRLRGSSPNRASARR